ncbi:OsmC family protein [Hephaestia mangrovi]|uniref:OsmC family protein n=1 Tax=Hephaestia mangrovi TaxID=2873268 RepID=UPI001CA7115E|nr:OsmC family protein [Hephaestia mangrovi]MBY8827565.1 OsmC family protein [Hephaestia mangrovi]
MGQVTVRLGSVAGMGATLGRGSGGASVVVDRPAGRAGGTGIGFNGAELLGLALGGCFANDLHYAADALGEAIERLAISVTVDLDGEPLVATAAVMTADVALASGGDPAAVIARAEAGCTIANTLRRGMSVDLATARGA